jgi:septum formation protein
MFFLKHLSGFDLTLCSASPRRKELLEQTGLKFRIEHTPFDESFNPLLPPHEIVLALCRNKACASQHILESERSILITADTIVYHQGQVLNKPANREEAIKMLNKLSGQTHQVLTGVCLKSKSKETSFFSETLVSFYELSTDEINYYCDTYKPYDKAGAYGIQEWIGSVGVSGIKGCHNNVVGLPVPRLLKELMLFTTEA